MLIQKKDSVYNLKVTRQEAVEIIKHLAESIGTKYSADVFTMAVSDVSKGDWNTPGVLRIAVSDNQVF